MDDVGFDDGRVVEVAKPPDPPANNRLKTKLSEYIIVAICVIATLIVLRFVAKQYFWFIALLLAILLFSILLNNWLGT